MSYNPLPNVLRLLAYAFMSYSPLPIIFLAFQICGVHIEIITRTACNMPITDISIHLSTLYQLTPSLWSTHCNVWNYLHCLITWHVHTLVYLCCAILYQQFCDYLSSFPSLWSTHCSVWNYLPYLQHPNHMTCQLTQNQSPSSWLQWLTPPTFKV